nr:hypothetical protein [Lysinibacillus timonensis]
MKLNKSVSFILFILFSILIFGTNYGQVYGKTDVTPSFEELFTEGGYKTVEGALTEFEQHFKQELNLPLRIPPLKFSHQFGRFHNLDDDINDYFEVKFISDQIPENHYKITVRPIEHKIEFSDMYGIKVFKLKNGNDALYIEPDFVFKMLAFESNQWQYVLYVDKRVDKVTPEILIQIANSIDY